MYYATQTNVCGAPGNLAAFTPVPATVPQYMNYGMGGNVQVIAPSVNTPVVHYSSPDAIGNMVGMQNVGVVR